MKSKIFARGARFSLKQVFKTLPFTAEQPNAVICHTVKGKGIPFVENNLSWHHKSRLDESEKSALYDALEEVA